MSIFRMFVREGLAITNDGIEELARFAKKQPKSEVPAGRAVARPCGGTPSQVSGFAFLRVVTKN